MVADFKPNGASGAREPATDGRAKPINPGNAIEVDHIVKKYGDFTAVNDVTFNVKEEEIFGLLGPNGAGKSTLIRMMTTLIPITAGGARVAGHDVTKDPDGVRRTIGVIPQALTSDLDLTIEENLNIYAKLYDVPAQKRKAAIDELLELVDLTKWRGAQTKTLSGGMRRRLEIARGLVHSPRIFFLDEPTTGLDPVSRVAVWEMLTNIKSHRQLTILITTHYMDEADRLCDRIAVVDLGLVIAEGTPDELKRQVGGERLDIRLCESTERNRAIESLSGFGDTPPYAEDGSVRVPLRERRGAIARAVRMLDEAGVAIDDITIVTPTLDDVFLQLTGHAAEEGENA
jgi:ABC-2 type transport system ATP-binding protein